MNSVINHSDHSEAQLEAVIERLSEFDPVFEFFVDGSIVATYVDESGQLRQERLLAPDNEPSAAPFAVNLAPGSRCQS